MSCTKAKPGFEDSLNPSCWGIMGPYSSDKKKSRHDRFVPDLVGTNLYNVFKE